MRNSSIAGTAPGAPTRTARLAGRWACLGAVAVLALAACTNQPRAEEQKKLNEMGADFDQQRYGEVVAAADELIRQSPQGAAAAQALYLRGRSFEDRVAANPAESRANLQQAREAFTQALAQSPAPRLEGYIRACLANVAYFQDDYATALEQWTAAVEKLDRDELRAWSLYRSGLCQQRLGRFVDADGTFAAVQQQFPGTVPAQRANSHQGARAFYVQLATFSKAASADRAERELRGQGVVPQRITDGRGYHIVRVGPVGTYADAKRLQQRFTSKYDDSIILP